MNTATRERAPTAADNATVLAFDFGTRKIGVAVGNTGVRIAHPLTTIAGEANALRFKAIDALVAEWMPRLLVVGHPLNADGTINEMTGRAGRFARQLDARFRLPVVSVDERYTSRTAAVALIDAGVHGRAREEAMDEVAAQVILQAWFDDHMAPAGAARGAR